MTLDEHVQSNLARRAPPVAVTAIRLRRIGDDVSVLARIDGNWLYLINARLDGDIDRTIHANVIRSVVAQQP